MAQVDRGSGGVTLAGNVYKMYSCNTWGHGFVVNMAMLGEKFGLNDLRGLFQLNNSMTP